MTGGKLVLKKSYRKTIEAAKDYAAKFDAHVGFDLVTGKHPKLIVTRGGKVVLVPFPCTPRSDNPPLHARRAITWALRQMESADA